MSSLSLNTLKKGIILFLLVCIPLRIVLAGIAKVLPVYYLPIMGLPFLIFGIGALYMYLTDTRTTGGGAFGGVLWWKDMRPIHGLLYLSFAILAFLRYPHAWILLAVDVLVGLVGFLTYHTVTGNFTRLVKCK